jgi:D-alanine-D-alanine ligase-like ATP-grasp enzyme
MLRDVLQSIDRTTTVTIAPITLLNYQIVLEQLKQRSELTNPKNSLVVFNLCDGTEDDGYPGLSIVKLLETMGLAFTGAGSDFYENTTSKIVLKQFLIQEKVPTSQFISIRPEFIKEDVEKASEISDWPFIIKPAISYASISITDRSVVDSKEDAIKHIQSIIHEKNGGVFMETFLAGNEFTAVVTGDEFQGTHVYPVAERVFNSKLNERQKILAFDRCTTF